MNLINKTLNLALEIMKYFTYAFVTAPVVLIGYLIFRFYYIGLVFKKNGFNSLMPLQEEWTNYRMVIYVIAILILVLFGIISITYNYLIKLDPEAKEKSKNISTSDLKDETQLSIFKRSFKGLPLVVLTLLITTFSFAIAALVLDLIQIISKIFGVE